MKYLSLVFIALFVTTFASAISFEGKTYSFSDLNITTTFESPETCVFINLSDYQKNELVSYSGIYGLFLHVKNYTDDGIIYVVTEDGFSYRRNMYGFETNYGYLFRDIQKDYLFISLEELKDKEFYYLCVRSNNNLELYSDSTIGSYKIPYFSDNDFTKDFVTKDYKLNEKTPIEVKVKNSGYDTAKIFLFYDNEIFAKWFKLKDGVPSLEENVIPNYTVELRYNIVPVSDKSFTVSPAVLRYDYKGYIFTNYSNGLVSNARMYLDEILVNLTIDKKTLDLNETSNIEVVLYNDSSLAKEAVLNISGLKEFGLSERYALNLEPLETKTLTYNIKSADSKVVTLDLSIATNDGNSSKILDSQTVSIGHNISNYSYIFVIFAIVLVLGIIVYYKFWL